MTRRRPSYRSYTMQTVKKTFRNSNKLINRASNTVRNFVVGSAKIVSKTGKLIKQKARNTTRRLSHIVRRTRKHRR
jgi:hypothetical protein